MKKVLTINGKNIHDIPSLYNEINRVFMADQGWEIGESLDALDELLCGAYGVLKGDEPVELHWLDMEKSRNDLGFDTTREFYRHKLRHPDLFNIDQVLKELGRLDEGQGLSYFQIVLQIIETHPNIELVPT